MSPIRMSSHRPGRLPRLPFGERWTGPERVIDPEQTGLTLHARTVRRLAFPDTAQMRAVRTAAVQVGALEFTAAIHPPMVLDLGEASDPSIIIPRFGAATCSTGMTRYMARAGLSVAFLSGAAQVVETGLVSLVAVRLDSIRLRHTARSMHGDRAGQPPDLDLACDRALSLHAGGLPMERMLGHLFELFDLVPASGLAQLGLDDLFYRYMVNLLCPELHGPMANPVLAQPGSLRREVDVVCEYVRAHFSEPITLTVLESISGLSQRSLQLAFQKQFGCTPMQWVRQIRLDMARKVLLNARPGDTVTKIALDCGFTQLSGFSQAFLARFGELPSDTLRQNLAGS